MWTREPARLTNRDAPLRALGSVLAVIAVMLAHSAGWLSFVEAEFDVLRYRASERQATGNLVIVGIDPASLRELGVWPWPRSFHATVIRRLTAAGARQIGIDVDLSSSSTLEHDLDLQRALIETGGRVVLPVFQQINDTEAGPELHITAPLPLLQPYARLASVNVIPDRDGIVRSMATRQTIGDIVLPTLSAALADPGHVPDRRFGIDFSIAPRTLPRLSFADVLAGRFDPKLVAGKSVLVGATAIELSDQLPVPLQPSLSGVLIHGLAYETLSGDRAIQRLPRGAMILLCAASALLLHLAFRSRSWQQDSLVLVAFVLAVVLGSVHLFVASPVIVDITPILLVAVLVFALAVVSRIDEQALQLLLQRLRLGRIDALLQRIVDDSFDGILIMGADGLIQRCNGAAAQIFGMNADSLTGSPVTALLPAGDDQAPRQADHGLLAPGAHELNGRRPDGAHLAAELTVSRLLVGKEIMLLAIVRDVSARKRHEAHLDYIAHHDMLTELPNRRQLGQQIDQAIAHGESKEQRLAVLILDLDRLKDINDTLGHAVGDDVLREAASRLRRSLRAGDQIARLVGDQFCVLAHGVQSGGAVEDVAQRLLGCLAPAFQVGGLAIEIAATIGIAFYPDDGGDATTLLRCADIALHVAQKRSQRISCYDAAADTTSVRRLAISSDLRRAIANHELVLAFQPKIDLASQRVCGAEALVRWRHRTYGLISPDEFIGRAEVTGLIRPLTYWVVGEGVKALAEVHRRGFPMHLSLNLSAKNLFDRELPDTLLSLAQDAGMDPSFLILEITENAMMHDPVRAVETADRLRGHGFGLSIDDFGTGYSSLAYLKRLPVQELKIDKSFVINMHDHPTDAQIVKSTIALAHALDLRVVAEGIELPGHVERLSGFGCDIGQGYFFSRPLPFQDFLGWLIDREGTTGVDARKAG